MQPVKLTGLWIVASIGLLVPGYCTIKPCQLAQVLSQILERCSQGLPWIKAKTWPWVPWRINACLRGMGHGKYKDWWEFHWSSHSQTYLGCSLLLFGWPICIFSKIGIDNPIDNNGCHIAVTADATTARYGISVVSLNSWQSKEESKDALLQKKKRRKAFALPLLRGYHSTSTSSPRSSPCLQTM
jgi:hypothetical protein